MDLRGLAARLAQFPARAPGGVVDLLRYAGSDVARSGAHVLGIALAVPRGACELLCVRGAGAVRGLQAGGREPAIRLRSVGPPIPDLVRAGLPSFDDAESKGIEGDSLRHGADRSGRKYVQEVRRDGNYAAAVGRALPSVAGALCAAAVTVVTHAAF